MNRQFFILYLFLTLAVISFASDNKFSDFSDFSSQFEQAIIEKYNLANSHRVDKQFDKCLSILFEISDDYFRANFDIASIFYQDYKNYDLALHFFDKIIKTYESNNSEAFLKSNEDIYKNSLFFSAYIYINDLELYTNGINRYKIFVKKFPNDELADDAIHELNALNSEKNQIELLKNNLK